MDNFPRNREAAGRRGVRVSRSGELQFFQQLKVVDLWVSDIRKKSEEFFMGEIPRGIEEAIAVCERELEERIRTLRMSLVAESLGRDPGVARDPCWRTGDIGQWKRAVEEALEERIRKKNCKGEKKEKGPRGRIL